MPWHVTDLVAKAQNQALPTVLTQEMGENKGIGLLNLEFIWDAGMEQKYSLLPLSRSVDSLG